MGRIRVNKNKPYSIYIASIKESVIYIIKNINDRIRLKVPSFKEACVLYNIGYVEADYNIDLYNPYFGGLVDTRGSIVFNYAGNKIECNLEFKQDEYTTRLNFDNTILESKPKIKREKYSKSNIKKFTSIYFKFKNVNNMLFIYDYFMRNRLYCGIKFFRISKIKSFFKIRKYKTSSSVEQKIYCNFLID
jgi:hypothetical protein